MNKRDVGKATAGALAAFALVAAAACGGDGEPSVSPQATSTARAADVAGSTPVATAASTVVAAATPVSGATAGASSRLNLNTATGPDYLAVIPGFSDRMVKEFLEYRPYVSIAQFRQELGKYVDESQITEWEQYVYVPVDVNTSDSATLMQLPGVDETVANALISARDYTSNDAFLAALREHVTSEQVSAASTMLTEQP